MHVRISGRAAAIAFVALLTWCYTPSGFSQSARASADDLHVGQAVAIEGKSIGARTVHANEIEIQRESHENKLKGRIQHVDSAANSLVILGTTVVAAHDAQIAARDGSVMPFSDLQKGWMVKVKGRLQEQGALQASEIKVSREEAPDEAEVEGRVQSLDKARGTLIVAGLTIRLTPATKFKFD